MVGLWGELSHCAFLVTQRIEFHLYVSNNDYTLVYFSKPFLQTYCHFTFSLDHFTQLATCTENLLNEQNLYFYKTTFGIRGLYRLANREEHVNCTITLLITKCLQIQSPSIPELFDKQTFRPITAVLSEVHEFPNKMCQGLGRYSSYWDS